MATTKTGNVVVTPSFAKATIKRFGIKISAIAKQCDLQRFHVYAFLEPAKYRHIRLSDEQRQRLEKWFGELAA